MAKVSIKYIIYYKYRQTDGRYPIKLRFTYNRVPALVPTCRRLDPLRIRLRLSTLRSSWDYVKDYLSKNLSKL